jgi:hypothetical protein
MKSVPLEPFDNVNVTTSNDVTCICFVNTAKEAKKKTDRELLLETLAKSNCPFKYIVMGRNDEYNELGNNSLRPFGTIMEAIAYGQQISTKCSRGYRSFHSYIIQPLLKDIDSFVLTSEQVTMICDIEKELLL